MYPGLYAVVVRCCTAPLGYCVVTVVEAVLGGTAVTPVGTSTTLAFGGGTYASLVSAVGEHPRSASAARLKPPINRFLRVLFIVVLESIFISRPSCPLSGNTRADKGKGRITHGVEELARNTGETT